ncbi:MAG: hypothetical protein CEO22_239 [Candidatus Berkelbacteria bacterium Gr01-1014_85]|uniref:Ribulose-phosphate 3-epimerase n=1 Tax=Candidatus Berkelbacteria bacterium Gr01-1014_85 TaxID=2017150 RepID=A0A554JCF5_9BACT|nr:MAG: hypothetical protein CEO22_239 [Candidatus Berkelbacteria bacterium Gr01-1014_85]
MQPTFYPAYWPDPTYSLDFHRLILTELAELADVIHLDFVDPDFGSTSPVGSTNPARSAVATADWQAILDHPTMDAIRPRLLLHLMSPALVSQTKLAIKAGIKHFILPTTDWSEFVATQTECQKSQCYYLPSLEPTEMLSEQQQLALSEQPLMMGLNLMGVDSGATGQPQQTERLLSKIAIYRETQPNWLLAVDGGVRLDNVASLWQAGVSLVFASQYGYWPSPTSSEGFALYQNLAADLPALTAELAQDRHENQARFASFATSATSAMSNNRTVDVS